MRLRESRITPHNKYHPTKPETNKIPVTDPYQLCSEKQVLKTPTCYREHNITPFVINKL